jgi:hypothetical protein
MSKTIAKKKGHEGDALDAKLTVSVSKNLRIDCTFESTSADDQSFQNYEYRYFLFDESGSQLSGSLEVRLPIRPIKIPGNGSTKDPTDAVFKNLEDNSTYYFVVIVRNLAGMAKFVYDQK